MLIIPLAEKGSISTSLEIDCVISIDKGCHDDEHVLAVRKGIVSCK